jgi:hypothetical protein
MFIVYYVFSSNHYLIDLLNAIFLILFLSQWMKI